MHVCNLLVFPRANSVDCQARVFYFIKKNFRNILQFPFIYAKIILPYNLIIKVSKDTTGIGVSFYPVYFYYRIKLYGKPITGYFMRAFLDWERPYFL